jgi:hypothetical protein
MSLADEQFVEIIAEQNGFAEIELSRCGPASHGGGGTGQQNRSF